MKQQTFKHRSGVEFTGYELPHGLIVFKWNRWGWCLNTVTGEGLLPNGMGLPREVNPVFPTRKAAIALAEVIGPLAPWDKITRENATDHITRAEWDSMRQVAYDHLRAAWEGRR